jgi:hypothetical protein
MSFRRSIRMQRALRGSGGRRTTRFPIASWRAASPADALGARAARERAAILAVQPARVATSIVRRTARAPRPCPACGRPTRCSTRAARGATATGTAGAARASRARAARATGASATVVGRGRRWGRWHDCTADSLDRSRGSDAGKAGTTVSVRGARLSRRLTAVRAALKLAASSGHARLPATALGCARAGVARHKASQPAIVHSRIGVAPRHPEGVELAREELRRLRTTAVRPSARNSARVIRLVVMADVALRDARATGRSRTGR